MATVPLVLSKTVFDSCPEKTVFDSSDEFSNIKEGIRFKSTLPGVATKYWLASRTASKNSFCKNVKLLIIKVFQKMLIAAKRVKKNSSYYQLSVSFLYSD